MIKETLWIIKNQFHLIRKKINKKPFFSRLVIKFSLFLFILFICLIAVDLNFLWLFGKSPKISDINNPKFEITSELYSADGKLIGKYFSHNRTPVKYEEISPLLIKTLIATEDSRFYLHHGIDIKASFSIFWYMLKGDKRGGSTITQQLVKNLFKTRSNYSTGLLGKIPILKILIYKTKEWINALKIEFYYSKKEILTLYLNAVDFGCNAYGIKTAAKTYFNRLPSELNATQCAMLIGMLKAPSQYSPVQHPESCRERRNTVLGIMLKKNIISQKKYDHDLTLPLNLNYNVEDNYDGCANYFRIAVSRYLSDWLKQNNIDIYKDGLKIYSTLDSRLQQYAEEAVSKQMKYLYKLFQEHLQGKSPWMDEQGNEIKNFINEKIQQDSYYHYLLNHFSNKDSIANLLNHKHKMTVFTWNGEKDTTFSHVDSLVYYLHFLHAGFINMDPNTGQVKCWVGDLNFKYFKFDHVKQSKRQPGSTFKAFVYTAAIDNGYSPCDLMQDIPVSITYTEKGEQKIWSPQNVTWEFTGESITLKNAFARSVNSIAVQLTKKLGWQKVIEYAHKLGINTTLENVPSVAIGTSDVSLFELVKAYCPLVNGGFRVEPLLVTRIEDHEGNIIKDFSTSKVRVVSEETSFLMNQMLQGGLTEPEATTQALFAYDLFRSKIQFGGKTGTSQNYSDGWFVGVTPHLIGGAWVGGQYRCIHFRNTEQGEGCKTALPIFGLFMEKVLKDNRFDYLKVPFPKPASVIKKNYSCYTLSHKNDSLQSDSISK